MVAMACTGMTFFPFFFPKCISGWDESDGGHGMHRCDDSDRLFRHYPPVPLPWPGMSIYYHNYYCYYYYSDRLFLHYPPVPLPWPGMFIHTYTHPRARVHTNTHTHTHNIYTHTHTHTHTHSHTHTHTHHIISLVTFEISGFLAAGKGLCFVMASCFFENLLFSFL
jgi:hypothetical protein